MQNFHLHRKSYHNLAIDETAYTELAYERLKKLNDYEWLKKEGCSEEAILSTLAVTRSSYFRWKKNYSEFGLAGLENKSRRPQKIRKPKWTKEIESRIHRLRLEFKLWGKEKIAVMYRKKYGTKIATSTVGRILKSLLLREKTRPVAYYTGDYIPKPRQFKGHAKRIPSGLKPVLPGDLVQIVHSTVQLDSGKSLKHFKAVCPITKYSAEKYSGKQQVLMLQNVYTSWCVIFPFQFVLSK